MQDWKCDCIHGSEWHNDKGCNVWSCVNDRQYCECVVPNPGNVAKELEYED